eukprot:Em0013g1049a
MDGTPSRRDDNGDGKCIGAHLSNGDASSLLVNCGVEDDNASHRLDENGIRERGEEIEVLCAERQLLPSTTKDPEKARKCESSPGGIGDGPGEPFSRPRTIEEQCVTVSDQCENRRDSNHPTKNGTQDKVTALGSPASPARGEEEVSVDHTGSAGLRVEAGQEMEDGLVLLDSKAGPVQEAVDVSECGNSKVAGGNTSGCDVVKGDHSSCHERGPSCCLNVHAEDRDDITDAGCGSPVTCFERQSNVCVMVEWNNWRMEEGREPMGSVDEMSKALEQLRADNEQLLQRLSESSALHEEKTNALKEALKGWELKCLRVESSERQLKEERDRTQGLQDRVESSERQLKEERDRTQGLQDRVESSERQLKEERDRTQVLQDRVESSERQLKEERDRTQGLQDRVESSERQLKEVRDRTQGLQDRVESSECQLKEERDRTQGFQDRVESSERQLKEEKHMSAGHQARVKSLEQLLESERTKTASKMVELEKALVAKTEKITAIQTEAQSEKEDLVSRLVVIEHEKKRADDELATTERKLKEAVKEQERLQASIKNLNRDITKAQSNVEKSASEHQKQLAQSKEELNSLNVKLKWAQGKLKTETEAHNDCKAQLTAMTKKYQSAKEEGEQIRADLKAMIKQYQESEEMRSNSLGVKLRKTEDELRQQEQEIADQHQLHQLTLKELELIKSAHQITQQECQQLKTKMSELSTKMSEQKAEMDEHIITITKLKLENRRLTTKASGVDELTQQLESERSKVASANGSLSQLQQSYEGLEREVAQSKEKERELLAFSEKLSSANAELLAEKSSTEAKLSSLMEERQSLATSLKEAQEARCSLQTELNAHRELSDATISDLSQQLASKSEAVEQLTLSLDDEREQNNALKKKNASNLKDLQKQLQQCQRRIEQLEASNGAEAPATLPVSLASRVSSHESLDDGVVVLSNQPSSDTVQHDDDVQVHVTQNTGALFRHLDHEKEVLVEKLCVLKKEVAKKQEKLEFYEEHITQLTDEIKKKSKIIQDFVVREQSGAVASPLHDSHKAKRARKGGVMASVFTGKMHHNEMTFDLSLEINRKMQSVLEDALLKNIMLKENIDTLGNEIAKLTAQLQQGQNNCR